MRHKQTRLILALMGAFTVMSSAHAFSSSGLSIGSNSYTTESAIATGSGSIAAGKGAVATGEGLTGELIKQKLAENEAQLREIERLKKSVEVSEREFNEKFEIYNRVEAAKAKIEENNIYINDVLNPALATAAGNVDEYKPLYDAKVNELNARLDIITSMSGFDLSEVSTPSGLTQLATDLKTTAEAGYETIIDNPISYYEGYIQNYVEAHGNLASNIEFSSLYQSNTQNGGTDFNPSDVSLGNVSQWGSSSSGTENYIATLNAAGNISSQSGTSFKLSDGTTVLPYLKDSQQRLTQAQYDEYKTLHQTNLNNVLAALDEQQDFFLSTDEGLSVAKNWVTKQYQLSDLAQKIKLAQGEYDRLGGDKGPNAEAALAELQKKVAYQNEYDSLLAEMRASDSVSGWRSKQYQDWVKTNITDIQTANTAMNQKLRDDFNQAIASETAHMKQLNAELAAAEKAIDDINKQNAQLQPSERDLAEAAKAEAAKEKLEADKLAYQNALDTLGLNDLKDIGQNAIAIGTNTLVTGKNAIGMGTDTLVTGEDAIGIGHSTTVSGLRSIGIGSNNTVSGAESGAFGSNNFIGSDNSFVVGNNNNITAGADNNYILGSNVQIMDDSLVGNVVLGDSSTVEAAVATESITLNGKTYAFAGTTPTSTVSVGSAGNERTITNVAAGRIDKNSTDAVNGSQVFAIANSIEDLANRPVFDNTPLLFTADTGSTERKLGESLAVVGGNGNITTTATDGKLAINLADDLNLTSVTTGNSVMTNDGFKAGNVVISSSTGINAGGMRITNVADGLVAEGSTDAVTGNQLFATNSKITDIGDQVENNTTIITDLADKPLAFTGDTGSTERKLGESLAVVGGNGNINTTATDGKLAINLTDDLNLTSVTTGNSVMTNDGFKAGNVVISSSTGINAGGMKVTNVADGLVAEGSTDAVTGNQLFATNSKITDIGDQVENNTTIITDLADKPLSFAADTGSTERKLGESLAVVGGNGNINTTATDGKLAINLADDLNLTSVTTGNSVMTNDGFKAGNVVISSSTGINAGGMRITNVADGLVAEGSTDAVTGNQLFATNSKITDIGDQVENNTTIITDLADKPLSFAGDTGSTARKLGEELAVVGGNGNINTTATDGKLAINLADDLNLTSVTTGNSVMTNDGFKAGNVVISSSTGINAGGMRITNVADGLVAEGSTDAVTGNQLFATNSKITDIGDQVENNTTIITDLADKPLAFTGDTGSTERKLGESLAVVGGNGNITTTATDGKLAINLADDLNLTSVTTGNSVMNNDGFKAGNVVISSSTGINAGGMRITNVADAINDSDAVNFGQLKEVTSGLTELSSRAVLYDNDNKDSITLAGENGTTLTNLKDGLVAEGSKDAVTGNQLFATNSKLNNLGEQVNINTVSINNLQNEFNNIHNLGLVKQDENSGDISVGGDTGGNVVDVSGSDGDRRITGVAAGEKPNDVATVGQVSNVVSSVNQRIDNLQQDISRVDKNASAGTAAAMAMATLPQAWKPSQTGVAMGASNYRGNQGYALGVSHMSDNGKWVLKGSVAGSNRGSVGVAAGVFYSFD